MRRQRGLVGRLKQVFNDNQWLYVIVGLAIGLLLSPLINQLQSETIGRFIEGLIPEAVGIFFTVVFLDRLDDLRERRQVKETLLRRAHSRYNNTALEAIEELRVLDYLDDGSLSGLNLRGANWQDANLYKADLRGTDLTNAILMGADLVESNLTEAKVTHEQLAQLKTMHGATMPDGNRYDGRYRLSGDFAYAQRVGVNIHSAQELAGWYGVTMKAYNEGQLWADDHLPRMRNRGLYG